MYRWLAGTIILLGVVQLLSGSWDVRAPCPVREDGGNSLEKNKKTAVVQYRYGGNKVGSWMWDPEGAYVGKVVVVVGIGYDPAMELVKAGFVVWKKNLGCGNDACDVVDLTAHEEIMEGRTTMGSAYHYYSYLNDTSKEKPTAPYTAFLNSSLTGPDLITSLTTALHCAEVTSAYTPIHRTSDFHDYPSASIQEITETFNEKFKPWRRIRPRKGLHSWGGGEFIVPSGISDTIPRDALKKLLDRSPTPSYFHLMTYHVIFNMTEVVGTTAGIPACDYPDSTPTVKKIHLQPQPGYHSLVDTNEMGTWVYPVDVDKRKDVVVVVGGTDVDPTPELVSRGYTVWRRNEHCALHLARIWGAVQEKRHSRHICTESWGYLGYLTDRDVARPTAEYTAFVHGHLISWHQPGDLALIIDDAVQCAKVSQQYTPLTMVDMMDKWEVWERQGVVAKWIKAWNKMFGDIREIKGDRLQNWCCASFVLPRRILTANPQTTYDRYLAKRVRHALDPETQLTGFFSEYTHHLLFQQPEVVDITDLPQCPNFRYAEDFTHPTKSKRMYQQEETRRKYRGTK